MWLRRKTREQTAAEQRRIREEAVAADRSDDSRRALEHARAARIDARGHLVKVLAMSAELRRERVVNHFAADVFEAMRRKQ
jgi:hypothetical protein